MSDEKETQMIEVAGLGKVTKINDNTFKMTNDEAGVFYKDHGIPDFQEVIKTLNRAKGELVVAAVEGLLKPEVIKAKEAQCLRVGSGSGRMDITLENKVTRRNPKTGEYYDTYGVVKTKEHYKSPFKPGDKNGLFAKLSQDIEDNNK